MRCLFACVPAWGEFHPLVPLARALREAGHTVAFATAESMRTPVEGLGFELLPVGVPRTVVREELRRRFPALDSLPQVEREVFLRQAVSVGLLVELGLPPLRRAVETWRPDVLVRDPTHFASVLLAETLGIPHATVMLRAIGLHAVFRDAIREPLARWRRDLGLPPDADLAMLDRYLTLVPFPPTFRPPGEAAPATAHYLRPLVFNESGAEGLPDWVDALPAWPTVHMTLGTFLNAQDSALRAAIVGLADRPLNFIVATGRDRDPADLGPLPANVHAARYLPHSLLLPRCDLLISHAGAGTFTAALWHGLPQVAVPLADTPVRP